MTGLLVFVGSLVLGVVLVTVLIAIVDHMRHPRITSAKRINTVPHHHHFSHPTMPANRRHAAAIAQPRQIPSWRAGAPPRRDSNPTLDDLTAVAAALQNTASAMAAQATEMSGLAAKIIADVAALQSQPAPSPPSPQPSPPPPTPVSQPNWPSFNSTATLVGSTPDMRGTVYYDATLGPQALQNAQDLLADMPRVMAFNDATFGAKGGAVNVVVFALGGATDGTGGADHMGCDYATGQNIEVCASFGSSARVSALFEAELSECAMNNTLCGLSTGEALSRWCAMASSGNALSDFASAPTWAQDGYANWVDNTEGTDGDYDSIGCGMAFISWLLKAGATLPKVAQEMVVLGDAGTLSQLGVGLWPHASGVWTAFLAAVRALPGGVTSDDPFGALPGTAALARRAVENIAARR